MAQHPDCGGTLTSAYVRRAGRWERIGQFCLGCRRLWLTALDKSQDQVTTRFKAGR